METVKKEHISTKISDYLDRQEDVMFAYLFGSFVDQDRYRDIDIGIHMAPHPNLIRFGRVQAALDQLLKMKTDVVLLNDIPKKKPAFAFQVIKKGELLINKNVDLHQDYKERVLCLYFDTAYLREKMDQAFNNRVKAGKFALRNYE